MLPMRLCANTYLKNISGYNISPDIFVRQYIVADYRCLRSLITSQSPTKSQVAALLRQFGLKPFVSSAYSKNSSHVLISPDSLRKLYHGFFISLGKENVPESALEISSAVLKWGVNRCQKDLTEIERKVPKIFSVANRGE